MGTFSVTIEVGNPAGSDYTTMRLMVDTGASHTVLPRSLLNKLGVTPHAKGIFRLADGRLVERDIGQTWVRLDGTAQMTIVVFGDDAAQPLLGAVTLEEFRLGVDPVEKRLIPVPGLLLGHTWNQPQP